MHKWTSQPWNKNTNNILHISNQIFTLLHNAILKFWILSINFNNMDFVWLICIFLGSILGLIANQSIYHAYLIYFEEKYFVNEK